MLDRGRSLRAAAQAVGLTHTTVSRALEQGRLRAPNRPVPEPHGSGSRPSARSAGDALCAGGIGVKRTQERVRASTGQLAEAPPRFEAAETVAGAGVLLALPALLQQGLLDVTEGLYGRLNNGFFGLRSVLLTLAFMALLRIRSPEQLKAHAPGELGLLLGLDRAPEVKTVRRKLHEIGARKLSRTLADAFARRWAQAEPEALGYLYIDGHVRPYHGRRHRLPKTFVQRRRLCMPATTEVWVNDARAQPWFFVTTEANDHLLAAIERDILAPLRKEVGAQRRVTLVFDREGWSPKAFARWAAAGFDVMTYRKGRYDPWPQDAFVAVVDPTPSRGGKPVTWRLAECETDLGTGRGQPVFRMREVRRLWPPRRDSPPRRCRPGSGSRRHPRRVRGTAPRGWRTHQERSCASPDSTCAAAARSSISSSNTSFVPVGAIPASRVCACLSACIFVVGVTSSPWTWKKSSARVPSTPSSLRRRAGTTTRPFSIIIAL